MTDDSVSAFIQFSSDVCEEDNARDPYPDGGHNCPMKIPEGGKPEMPWVLVAMKLYAQQGGSTDSKCHDLLWGESADSLGNSPWVEQVQLHPKVQQEMENIIQ